MNRSTLLTIALTALSLAVIGVGCSSKTSQKTADQKTAGKTTEKGGTNAVGKSDEAAEIEKNLAKLSNADRAAVEKQATCLVGDGKLGAMGVPIKITVKGQDVWLCCDGCKDAIEKDPDKYLAKLKK